MAERGFVKKVNCKMKIREELCVISDEQRTINYSRSQHAFNSNIDKIKSEEENSVNKSPCNFPRRRTAGYIG